VEEAIIEGRGARENERKPASCNLYGLGDYFYESVPKNRFSRKNLFVLSYIILLYVAQRI